jgi:hypothetical protein
VGGRPTGLTAFYVRLVPRAGRILSTGTTGLRGQATASFASMAFQVSSITVLAAA